MRPFRIQTLDGESLYAWHILPLAVYTRHEASLVVESTVQREHDDTSVALGLLSHRRESLLVISCQ